MKRFLKITIALLVLALPSIVWAAAPPGGGGGGGGPGGGVPEPMPLWLLVAGALPALLLYHRTRRRLSKVPHSNS